MSNSALNQNTLDLQAILNTIENLPEAGTGEGGSAIITEPLEFDVSENNSTTVKEPDDGTAFSKVTVNVNVPDRYNEGIEAGKEIGRGEGYNEGVADGVASIKIQAEKTATENGVVEPDDNYDALAKVIVDVPQKTEVDLIEEISANDTFTYEPIDGETFKKVEITVKVEGGGDTTDDLGMFITRKIEDVESDISGTLGAYAFYENDTVKTISLPNIQYLKERCFYGCGALTTLLLPGLIGYTYQYMAYGCANLTTVDIHDTSYVSSYTFQNCTSLKKLDLHKVGTIGTNAFSGATKFETLIIRTDTVPTLGGTNAFTNTKIKSGGTGYIYVKANMIDSFKAATNWSSFVSQFRAIEDYPDICGGAS